jgi:branched-chain amino acid transport system substrate-binding protein
MHRRGLPIAVLALVALVSAACGDGGSSTTPGSGTPGSGGGDEALVMGLLVPQSGSLNAIVDSLAKPTKLAVDQINAAGGVNGKPVKLEQADDGSTPTVASTSFDNLVNSRKINVLVGPAGSPTALGIIDKIKGRSLPTCSGSTTASNLSDVDSGGYFFRTAPTDDLQGPALAEVVTNDGKTKVGILARNDDYGTGFAKAIEAGVKDSGATVVANVPYDPNGSVFDSDVSKVLAGSPDAIVVIGYNDDGAKVVSTLIAKGAGPDKIAMYTGDGMQSSKFAETVDPADKSKVKGLKGTAAASNPEGIDSPFQKDFPGLNVDPIYSSYYWDCTNLLALAAVKAKSVEPAKVKAAFAENVKGESDCNDFKSCKELLDAGKSIHYRGASNRFDKWAGNEPAGGAYEIWEYDAEGKVQTLKVPQIKI